MNIHQVRLKKELEMWQHSTGLPTGISVWLENEVSLLHWRAAIQGAEGSCYEEGTFLLELLMSERYPIEPPKVTFLTPIYHPNIDQHGRICLDLLNMPPKGNWKPSINIMTLLTSIQLLLNEPNPDDPLIIEIVSDDKELNFLMR